MAKEEGHALATETHPPPPPFQCTTDSNLLFYATSVFVYYELQLHLQEMVILIDHVLNE